MSSAAAALLCVVLLAAGALCTFVAGVAFTRRPAPGLAWLSLLAAGAAAWCGGYALEIGASVPDLKVAFAAMQYAGIVCVPVAWLGLGLRRTPGLADPRVAPGFWAAISVVPVLTLGIVASPAGRSLLWSRVDVPDGGTGPLALVHGPWFWVVNPYSQLLVLAGTMLLIRTPGSGTRSRRLLLLGALAPWAGNVVYLLAASRLAGLDPTPFGFASAALALWAALAGDDDILDIRPLARASVFDTMADGVVVLGSSGLVADMNAAAERLTGSPLREARGQRPEGLPGPVWPGIAEACSGPDGAGTGLSFRPGTMPLRVDVAEAAVHLDVRVERLDAGRHALGGQLVSLRDTTRLHAALDASRSSTAFNERIVSSAPVGIVTFDRELRVVSWNPFLARLTGLPGARVLGRVAVDVLPFLREAGLARSLERAAAGEASVSGMVPWTVEETARGGWTIVRFAPTRDDGTGVVTGVLALFEDVSERHRMEAELRRLTDALERRAGALSAILPVGVFRADASGRCLDVNERWCAISGLSRTQALADGWTDALHPDDRLRVVREWEAATAGAATFQSEYRFQPSGRPTVWASGVAVPERDSEGTVTGWIGVLTDVTSHRALEASLRASEALLRDVTDAVPGAVVRVAVDEDGAREVVFASRGATLLFGDSSLAAELGLAEGGHVVPLEDRARVSQAMLHAWSRGERLASEFRVAGPDGRPRWIRLRADPGRDAAGGVVYTGVLWDVSEEKRVEERLRLLSRALEATADFVVVADADWRIEYVNASFEQQTGHPLADVRGRRVGDVIDGGQPSGLIDKLLRAIAAGTPFQGVFTNRRRDGSLFHEEKTVTPVADEAGVVRHIVSTGRDITRRLELERELRRSETMATMGRLVAGVAHEVRNPLFAISSLLDAFEEELGAGETFQAYGVRLRREVARMLGLMQDLLDLGRPPSTDPSLCSPADVLDEAVEGCAGRAAVAGVVLRVARNGSLPHLHLDRGRMRQVFENLLLNAIDHSPRGREVSVEWSVADDAIECAVADAGPGFQYEDLQHLFEPFYSRRRGGTGLGLAIVQRIVEDHGGTVRAGNGNQGGARVVVTLPLERAS